MEKALFTDTWNLHDPLDACNAGGTAFAESVTEAETYEENQTIDELETEASYDAASFIEIATAEDFASIRNNLSANYILVADIDLSDYRSYNFDGNWQPLGSRDYSGGQFTGILNGNGHTIKNLKETLPDGLFTKNDFEPKFSMGLFNENNGTIENLTLEVNYSIPNPIMGYIYIGGIAAINNGTITNCKVKGNISVTGDAVVDSSGTLVCNFFCGGIAGINSGTITICGNESNIKVNLPKASGKYTMCQSNTVLGGIAGLIYNHSTIDSVYNTGKLEASFCGITPKQGEGVTSEDYYRQVGGIAGSNGCNISNAYNAGEVDGCGISGSMVMEDLISYCYNSGKVSSFPIANCKDQYTQNCYYLGGSAKVTSTASYLSENSMKNKASFLNFDFTNTWKIIENGKYAYPQLTKMIQNSAVKSAEEIANENSLSNKPDVSVSYSTHVQSYGWQSFVQNGKMAGTTGKAKRLEGIRIKVLGNDNLGIQYSTYCQSYGWLPWASNGGMAGTEGEAKRLEAIMISLTGDDKDYYDVYYRVHCQTYGWLNWAKNGEPSGSAELAKRLEGIQILVVKKGTIINTNCEGIVATTKSAFICNSTSLTVPVYNAGRTSAKSPVVPNKDAAGVTYRAYMQSYGWVNTAYDGVLSGVTGDAKRMEALKISLRNCPYSGSICYSTYNNQKGYLPCKSDDCNEWYKDGETAGTLGQRLQLEAIRIMLSGEVATYYDVYYRVHCQKFGWMGWAKNGQEAGNRYYGYRIEAIQIVLVKKGGAAPAKSYYGCTENYSMPFALYSASQSESEAENLASYIQNNGTKFRNSLGKDSYYIDRNYKGSDGLSYLERIIYYPDDKELIFQLTESLNEEKISFTYKIDEKSIKSNMASYRLGSSLASINITGYSVKFLFNYKKAQELTWSFGTLSGTDSATATKRANAMLTTAMQYHYEALKYYGFSMNRMGFVNY